MAATPQKGIMTLRAANGTTRTLQFYISDVANAALKFDAGSGASSSAPDYWFAPTNCVITDIAIVTGTADTTSFQLTVDGVQSGNIVQYSAFLTSLNNRPPVAIALRQGARLGGIQLT